MVATRLGPRQNDVREGARMLDRAEYGLTGEGAVWHHDWHPQPEAGVDSDRDHQLRLLGAAALGALVFLGLSFGVRRLRSRTAMRRSHGAPLRISRV